jgi:hypothetical protein
VAHTTIADQMKTRRPYVPSSELASRSARAARAALLVTRSCCIAAVAAATVTAPPAGAFVVRASNGHLYGVLYRANVEAAHRGHRRNARGEITEPLEYSSEHGPVMLKTKVYPIFWAPSGHPFPAGYEATIERYLVDVAASSTAGNVATNDWSIPMQYTNLAKEHISETFEFGGSFLDMTEYPRTAEENCGAEDPTKATRPCINDAEIQAEIKADVTKREWPMDTEAAPEDQYLLFTPPGVESCENNTGESCSYQSPEGYCGYHSSFEAETGKWLIYSNIPSIAGCASGQAPEGVNEPASNAERAELDGTLDTLNHELAESATDPLLKKRAWVNPQGNEIGDMCTSPVAEAVESVYGTPLGGSFEAFTAFNELIDSHAYYVQTLWSNAPTETPAVAGQPPAGCLQRMGPTPQFKAPEHLQAQLAATFNAESSYDAQAPITQYEWNFGDGSPAVRSASPTVSHTFPTGGSFSVSLKVSDEKGEADASTETLRVQVANATTTTTMPTMPTTTTTSTTSLLTPATTGAVAPRAARLAGKVAFVRGRIALVKLHCDAGAPCDGKIVLEIPARLLRRKGRHRRRGMVEIAVASYSMAAGASGTLRIRLGAKALYLLRTGRHIGALARSEAAHQKPLVARVALKEARSRRRRAKRRRH